MKILLVFSFLHRGV